MFGQTTSCQSDRQHADWDWGSFGHLCAKKTITPIIAQASGVLVVFFCYFELSVLLALILVTGQLRRSEDGCDYIEYMICGANKKNIKEWLC